MENAPLPLLVRKDPMLAPFVGRMMDRMERITRRIAEFTGDGKQLKDMALGHRYFGLHREKEGWIAREWAPNASAIFIIGDFSGWRPEERFSYRKIAGDQWELKLPPDALKHGDLFRLHMLWPGGNGDRIPAWATRVVQDPKSLIFNAQVWEPEKPYKWKNTRPVDVLFTPIVYETHIGMAGEERKISSYEEFRKNVLPRIAKAGYNTIQIMAIMEHPYYASFGYQVSNFFAPSSRFGTPDEFRALVDEAHGKGIRVIMDLIHSHAVKNENEGLSRYDGTPYQFFHDGPKGNHPAWDSRCFDYGKISVIHFLLSNCRYWLDEFQLDGFRFDGVTSMLYLDHGLGKNFTEYGFYYDDNQDEEAITYLALANRVIHEVHPQAVTVAEDMSGMPGLALSLEEGGLGFDYRLAMGTPDYWIKTIKERSDEQWDMGEMLYELTNKRREEKTIGYAESHDQAIVGDKTILFRLADKEMYSEMHVLKKNVVIDRGVALHKMIRLLTAATAGNGYLTFMGNEFGHPEWIDFPREGNGWSYDYARRQWSLADNRELRYSLLGAFDRNMVKLLLEERVLLHPAISALTVSNSDKVIIFKRAGLIFAFNFHPQASFTDYGIEVEGGKYEVLLDSDDRAFGGHGRVDDSMTYATEPSENNPLKDLLRIYLPNRTALVLKLKS